MNHPLWHDDNGPIEGAEVRIGELFSLTPAASVADRSTYPSVYQVAGIIAGTDGTLYVHGCVPDTGNKATICVRPVENVRRWERPVELVWAVPADLRRRLGEADTMRIADSIESLIDMNVRGLLEDLVESVFSALDRDATPEAVCTLPHEIEGDDPVQSFKVPAALLCDQDHGGWVCDKLAGHLGVAPAAAGFERAE